MKVKQLIAAALLLLGFCINAYANPILTDLPASTYVTKDGLDWTWASPVNEESWISNTLYAPSLHDGWRFATDAELAQAPTLADFDNGAIQSVAYWNSFFTHVDKIDLASGFYASTWGHAYYETLYVRDTIDIPEPQSLALLGLGLLGLIGAVHRKA
ncbi:PEP-CTERM sorting domain-containing protein [Niveibacterium terrae]|uniref:PEP-CTERM sorting domain-containing protein n=1 Tax=Niveibacterium terrae TaxID=3373598 RepID=UPI003A94A418